MIDDDQDDFKIVAGLLSDGAFNQYKTEWVSNFADGLAKLTSQEGDVYLIDYRLDGRTGLDLLDAVKGSPFCKPIIFLTGAEDPEIDMAAMEKGASYFVQKKQLTTDHLLERTIRYAIKRAADMEHIQSSEKLRSEKLAAEEANRAKSMFLANISHEIRTPLASIIGFSDLALETNGSTDCVEFLNVVRKNARHLLNLVNDLLDLSKIEAGRFETTVEVCDWRQIATEALETLRPSADEKSNTFEIEISGNIPKLLQTDPHCLRQILVNILGNANKFTRGGIIKMKCALDKHFTITVSDTGLGMSTEEQSRLFKPFSQGQPGLYRKFGGTGLGLNLSRKLARAIGGDLVLMSSSPGAGSSFSLILSAIWFTQPDLKISRQPSKQDAVDVNLAGLRVLLAEDSEDNQLLIGRILSRAGANVKLANNGTQAVEMALAENFDAVVMDIQMPEIDGFEATKKLRRAGCKSPIVALSAHAMSEMRAQASNTGFNAYLTKPIQPQQLIETLRSLCVDQFVNG